MASGTLPLNPTLSSQDSVKTFLSHMDDTDEMPALLMGGEEPEELEGY